MKSPLFSAGLPFLLALLLTGCAHSTPQPEEMSAQGHREEAAGLREQAGELEQAGKNSPSVGARPGGTATIDSHGTAEQLRRHAVQHEKAAEELELFEAQECAGIPTDLRSGCPLLRVEKVVDTPDGVMLLLKPNTDIDKTLDLIRCYFAFSRKEGHPGWDECPFNVSGVYALPAENNTAVRLVTQDPEARDLLRQRTRAIFPH